MTTSDMKSLSKEVCRDLLAVKETFEQALL